jgi:hypothetical protein
MRQIIVGAQVSMDGVMQAPGGPWEDRTKGFKFDGWVMPYSMKSSARRSTASSSRHSTSRSAPRPMRSHGGIAKLFKDIKKYVVSPSGDVDTNWQRSVLLRDIADVRRLRDDDGPNLVTQGSTELVHALLATTSSTR